MYAMDDTCTLYVMHPNLCDSPNVMYAMDDTYHNVIICFTLELWYPKFKLRYYIKRSTIVQESELHYQLLITCKRRQVLQYKQKAKINSKN